MFGAYLHMKNWQALGEPERAAKSKLWVIGSLVFLLALIVFAALLPDSKALDGITRMSGFGLVVAWYYAIGKSQQTYVAARFGKAYARRGWIKPLLVAILGVLAFFLFIFVAAVIAGLALGAATS